MPRKDTSSVIFVNGVTFKKYDLYFFVQKILNYFLSSDDI